jgi:hypothetical protein
MPTPSPEIVHILAVFEAAMTAPTFAKALVLIYGAILTPGRRTVSAALRVMGLGHLDTFGNYHRVLNRDRWSPWVMSRLLFEVLIRVFIPRGGRLVLSIDETLERRQGKRIKYKGRFHDAVRSTRRHVVTSLGVRWCCIALVVEVPWARRAWALPFLAVPVLAPKTSARWHKRHRTSVDWAMLLIEKIRRWQRQRDITLVGDGSYAAVALIQRCQHLTPAVRLVSRLRLDAVLHDEPGPAVPHRRGPRPKKGARQASLATRLTDPATPWTPICLPWYDGAGKPLEIATEVSLWYHRGEDPVRLRWVLVRCPRGSLKPAAFFCSDPSVTADLVLRWFVSRWNIEVTFEELRAHLGFETQRQWSVRAIERTTPCLFGLFSVLVVMAKILYPTPDSLPVRETCWYPKQEATFSDVLAAVRSHLWDSLYSNASSADAEMCLIPRPVLETLQQVACYST